MKQTAVEWLAEQIKDYDFAPITNNEEYAIVIPVWIFNDKLNQAKAMEKEQILNAVNYGDERGKITTYRTAEQYYNETYGK